MDTDYTRKSRFSATRRKEREGKGINVKPETIAQNNRKKSRNNSRNETKIPAWEKKRKFKILITTYTHTKEIAFTWDGKQL